MTTTTSDIHEQCATLIPGYDPWRDSEGYHFDEETAAKACDFFPDILVHIKGLTAGQPFHLEPWQKAIVGNLFGWIDVETGFRRYREGILYIPRKNGKTTLAAGVSNLLFYMDGEPGSEIYCAASDLDEAGIVFGLAREMVLRNPSLAEVTEIYKGSFELGSSLYKVLSSKPKHGLNAHGVIVDELHQHPSRHLVDALLTSTASRAQPMTLHLTTADVAGKESICNEKYEYAKGVQSGAVRDPEFLPVLYGLTLECDWHNPDNWQKANPNLGVSVQQKYIEREHARAVAEPRNENTFKRLHLNVQTEQESRWVSTDEWGKCLNTELDIPDRSQVFIGVDLSSTQDVTSIVVIHARDDGKVVVKPFFWIPQAAAAKAYKVRSTPWPTWSKADNVFIMPGSSIDEDIIIRFALELGQRFQVLAWCIDQWNGRNFENKLSASGANAFLLSPTANNCNEAVIKAESMISTRRIAHDGDPVLSWMIANAVVAEDTREHKRIDKVAASEKIDGVSAMIYAIAIWVKEQKQKSIYETRGLSEV